ncbi:MAG: polymer-forming cytoskeletal protein [Tepidiforma sp.]
MQIKKNPRDAAYPETVARYDRERPAAEHDPYAESAPEAAYGRGIAPRAGVAPSRPDEPRAEAPVRSESVIDRHSSFDGRFETEQDLRIEGAISGEVVCRGTLTLEKDASARARVQAREALVKGRLEGDIVCSGRLTIAATAVVTGTIRAPILVVEEGASISGNVDTTQKAADIVTRPAARSAEPAAPEAPQPAPRPARREAPSFALVSSDAEPVTAERR